MVHLRLNDKAVSPNPFINFTTALPAASPDDERSALDLLRALAAQVRPVMKKHGFTVNSFEEYEFNRVFAGRNWNAGEVVELVLRRPSGAFYPTPYLLNTLCHELAHIKHMNHGAQFHALWRALRGEVEALRRRGYYGDGMWSAGVRVGDGERVGGAGEMLGAEEVPEWTCGGAQEKKRPARTARRRRVARNRRQGGATETGRQTERRRKPGGRVRAEVFGEGGARLDGRTLDEKEGSTKGKRAHAKEAREARAEAAERRLRALRGASAHDDDDEEESETEEEDGVDEPESDDESRRAGMLRQMKLDEMESLSTSSTSAADAAGFGSGSGSGWGGKDNRGKGKGKGRTIIDLTQEEEEDDDDDEDLPDVSDMLGEDFVSLPTSERAHVQALPPPPPTTTTTTSKPPTGNSIAGKSRDTPASTSAHLQASSSTARPRPQLQPNPIKRPRPLVPTPPSADGGEVPRKRSRQEGLGSILREEMLQRRAEGVGFPKGRRLGGPMASPAPAPAVVASAGRALGGATPALAGAGGGAGAARREAKWACGACTFLNHEALERCEMCGVGERPAAL